jgi:hypothetical protein
MNFIKLGIDIVPLEATTPQICTFQLPIISNTIMTSMRTSEVEATKATLYLRSRNYVWYQIFK